MKPSKIRRIANLKVRVKEQIRQKHLNYEHKHSPHFVDTMFLYVPAQLNCLGIHSLQLESYWSNDVF